MLNVSTPEKRDFYEIWEEAYRQQVENYTTKNGDNVTVTKNEWIDKMPSILTMQLNRLSYDLKTSKAEKSLHKLPICKVIYPDRFSFKNRD